MKQLPASYRAFAKEVRAAADTLASTGALYAFRKGSTQLFFLVDPLPVLDAAILPRLIPEPRDKDGLKKLVGEVAPGHAVVLDAWLKRALTRRALHEHAPKAKGAKKRYGTEPDIRKVVAPLITALKKACEKTDSQGISRERLAALLLNELGVSRSAAGLTSARKDGNGAPQNGDGRAAFLAALEALGAENPRQALLSVRDLRSRLSLGKQQFDALALQLMREGSVSLHHHDHPASLPEPERQRLIADTRGTYYVGIAPRRGA